MGRFSQQHAGGRHSSPPNAWLGWGILALKMKKYNDQIDETLITEEFEDNSFEESSSDIPSSSLSMYISDMSKIPLLSTDEERELARKIQAGDHEALNQMVSANLRLVISIAKRYQHYGLPMEDLIQDGNLGLITAAQRFDVEKGFKFSTYATWWIRQSISRGLYNNGRNVRLPVHIHEKVGCLKKKQRELMMTLDHDPTEEELAKALKWSTDEVAYLLSIMYDTVSLDVPIGEDGESAIGDFIPDTTSKSVEEDYEKKERSELINKALDTLAPREKLVIELRFGLSGRNPMTLEEIGEEFGLTRERIRQIETKAMRKIQHPARARILKGYIPEGRRRRHSAY